MKLNRQQIQTLVRLVADTKVEEIDCDEMMRVLTEYAEKLVRGESPDATDDEVIQHHLEICPECCEELEMLRGIADEGTLGTN